MENGVQALMMAFAVLIFIIALSIAFTTFTEAKQTADVVLKYSDREQFQTLQEYDKDNYEDGARIITKDTVIATIARCTKEKFTVKIIDTDKKQYNFEYDIALSQDEIQNEFNKFINESKGKKFKETYVEVTTSGKVYTGDDGTNLAENAGKKLYITYEAVE